MSTQSEQTLDRHSDSDARGIVASGVLSAKVEFVDVGRGWGTFKFSAAQPLDVSAVPARHLSSHITPPTADGSWKISEWINDRTLKCHCTWRIFKSHRPLSLFTKEDESLTVFDSLYFRSTSDNSKPEPSKSKRNWIKTDIHLLRYDTESYKLDRFLTCRSAEVKLREDWGRSCLNKSDWESSRGSDGSNLITIHHGSSETIALNHKLFLEHCIADMCLINDDDNPEGISKFQFFLLGKDPDRPGHVHFMVDAHKPTQQSWLSMVMSDYDQSTVVNGYGQ